MDIALSELVTCCICLETLNEPHQYPCGHSYCLSCINDLRSSGDNRCPECRAEFTSSDHVLKNYRLVDIVETFRSGEQQKHQLEVTAAATKSRRVEGNAQKTDKRSETKSTKHPPELLEGGAQSEAQGGRSGGSQRWRQLIALLFAAISFLAIFWMITSKMEGKVHSNLMQTNPRFGSSVSEGVWVLVCLPFWCVWLLLRLLFGLSQGLWWLTYSLLSLLSLCLRFSITFLLQLIILGSTVVDGIFNAAGYFYGSCIIGCLIIVCERILRKYELGRIFTNILRLARRFRNMIRNAN